MSACSVSSPRRCRAPRGVARGVLALALLGTAAVPAVHAASRPDSGRAVKRVAPPDRGVTVIETSGSGRQGDKIRIRGDLHVGDRHVVINDSMLVRRHASGTVDLGSGVHIETDDASIVRMFSDVTVDSLEQVDGSVVALFGNVTILGRVTGDVVAVLGSVRLAPEAVVNGDAVAIGGALDQPPTATVHGESVSLTFFPVLPGVPPLRAISLMLFALWVVAMILGGVLAVLAPRRIQRVADTISERTGWSLLLGFFLPPLATMAAVLLAVTVIGIPIAFLLPLLYLVILWAGLVAATYLLGNRLMGRPIGQGSMFLAVLVGSLIVAVLFGAGAALAGPPGGMGTVGLLFPALGLLFATALAVVGSGAVLVSGFGTRERMAPAAPAAPVPPVASVPPTAAPPGPTAPPIGA